MYSPMTIQSGTSIGHISAVQFGSLCQICGLNLNGLRPGHLKSNLGSGPGLWLLEKGKTYIPWAPKFVAQSFRPILLEQKLYNKIINFMNFHQFSKNLLLTYENPPAILLMLFVVIRFIFFGWYTGRISSRIRLGGSAMVDLSLTF